MTRHDFFLCCFVLLWSTHAGLAAELTFDSAAEWETWEVPYGLVQVGAEGQLQLTKYRKEFNAVEDAPLFTHATRTRGSAVAGGVWDAGTRRSTASRVIDGDPGTYWQPDPR